MHKPILLLRLEGPLQSWGTRSRWDRRDSGDEPTKSGVTGLLGCAMGLPRGDATLLELDSSLRFGVRVESAGRKVTDYQTITGYLPVAQGGLKFSGGTGNPKYSSEELKNQGKAPTTVLSPRDYLEDAAFLVGLEAREGGDALLQKAAQAVQAPHWPLFLGRKACVPTRPIFADFTTQYENLGAALAQHPWEWLGFLSEPKPDSFKNQGRKEPVRRLAVWIETNDSLAPGAVSRQDVLQPNAARVFGFRFAKPFFVPLENVKLSTLNENSP